MNPQTWHKWKRRLKEPALQAIDASDSGQFRLSATRSRTIRVAQFARVAERSIADRSELIFSAINVSPQRTKPHSDQRLRTGLASLRFISRNKAPAPSDPIDVRPRSDHCRSPVFAALARGIRGVHSASSGTQRRRTPKQAKPDSTEAWTPREIKLEEQPNGACV